MDTFLSVEEARQRILGDISSLGTERLFVTEATGRRIAESVVAPEDSPRFDNSSRDGYAVRWDDLSPEGTTLEITESASAGHAAAGSVDSGEAARIATGAKLPAGADTVVMQENCEVENGRVHIPDPPSGGRGSWVRAAGSHMAEGETLLEPGAKLGPADIGMLAGFRDARLEVHRAPTVAVVSTGDELVDIDDQPGEGEIVNTNAYLLETLLESAGADAVVLPTAPDEPEPTRTRFEEAVETADLVVSSGGVSVGTHDEVRGVVDELTGGMEFWKIRMKPGKPLAFGTTSEGVPLLGLPGNPNSCFVCFHQFVAPVLALLQGADPEGLARPQRLRAVLSTSVESTPHRRHYLAGHLESSAGGTPEFVPAARQSSGNVGLFSGEDCFGIVPEGEGALESGADIEVERLSGLW